MSACSACWRWRASLWIRGCESRRSSSPHNRTQATNTHVRRCPRAVRSCQPSGSNRPLWWSPSPDVVEVLGLGNTRVDPTRRASAQSRASKIHGGLCIRERGNRRCRAVRLKVRKVVKIRILLAPDVFNVVDPEFNLFPCWTNFDVSDASRIGRTAANELLYWLSSAERWGEVTRREISGTHKAHLRLDNPLIRQPRPRDLEPALAPVAKQVLTPSSNCCRA
jgi:hypothetical protein